ncbi:MAG: sulfotransferase [Litorimonas sp.]
MSDTTVILDSNEASEEGSNEVLEKAAEGPIFIVGNGRSGTSVMLSTVRKTLSWKYHGEGHLYPLLRELSLASNKYFDSPRIKNLSKSDAHLIHHIKRPAVNRRLAKLVRELFLEIYGTTEFVDKTPGPASILSLPILQAAFPKMKIIHMKRRGIEVVRSAVKKFNKTDFETHCNIWKRALANWDIVEPRLIVPHITIDQNTLATEAEVTVERLKEFLDLNPKQAQAMLGFFQNDRPQSSGNLNKGGISLETSGWSDEEIEIYRRVGNKMMARHGWSEDEKYFA